MQAVATVQAVPALTPAPPVPSAVNNQLYLIRCLCLLDWLAGLTGLETSSELTGLETGTQATESPKA